MIAATATLCAALTACGGGGDGPSSESASARSEASVESTVQSQATEADAANEAAIAEATAMIDSRLDSPVPRLTKGLEVAMAEASVSDASAAAGAADPAALEPTEHFDSGAAATGAYSTGSVATKSLSLPTMSVAAIAADWISSASATAAPAAPAHGSVTRQTPPQFSWPAYSGAASYRLEVSGPGGTRTKTVRGNWALFSTDFTSGTYQWRVQALNSSGSAVGAISSWRTFSIAADAVAFKVPEPDALLASIKARSRPRSLPGNGNFDEQWASRIRSERSADLNTWYNRVKGKMGTSFVAQPSVNPDSLSGSAATSAYTSMPGKVNPSIDYMVEEALVARIKNDSTMLKDAARRAVTLAGWNPTGATGHEAQDQVNRYIASALAAMYDQCYPVLTDSERSKIRSVVQTRLKAPYDELVGSRALERVPYDSHGFTILGHIAAATALMAGESSQFDAWAKEAIPLFANLANPWGGEDGGYGGGSAYGSYVLSQIPTYDALREATGIDVWKKAWGRNFGVFMTHMYPPGAPSGAFGDESEFAENTKNFVSLSRRVDVPLVKWKASKLSGYDRTHYSLVAAPFIGGSAPAGFTPPKAEVFANVGVVSIQTDLADSNRASLYFRSSPYGSYVHGHADQNAFILNVGSKRTFINSGVYDSYGSSQFNAWYEQTKAHNTITYDGGVGQAAGSMAARGRITAFHRNAAGYTLTSGDAQKAYPSGTNVATRTIVAAPDGSFVTVDQLSASSARRWEYNLHVPTQATSLGNDQARVSTSRGNLCIKPLAGSQAASWWNFSQTKIQSYSVSKYSNMLGTYQMKWTAPSAVAATLLPVHYDFGCDSAAPTVSQSGGQVTIKWQGYTWVVDNRGKLVTAS